MRSTAIQTYRRLLRSRVNPGLVPMTTGLMDELNPRVKPVQGACVWKDGSNPLPTTFKEDKTKAHREMEKIRANPARFNAAHEKRIQDSLIRAKAGLMREELEQALDARQSQRPGESSVRYV